MLSPSRLNSFNPNTAFLPSMWCAWCSHPPTKCRVVRKTAALLYDRGTTGSTVVLCRVWDSHNHPALCWAAPTPLHVGIALGKLLGPTPSSLCTTLQTLALCLHNTHPQSPTTGAGQDLRVGVCQGTACSSLHTTLEPSTQLSTTEAAIRGNANLALLLVFSKTLHPGMHA